MKLTKTRLKQIIKEELQAKRPKVTCHCLCLDCVFNKNEYCIAENIELEYATTSDGRRICECTTYKVDNNRNEA